ncbi:MAG: transaldolase [Burkholderiales bacterium]
MNAVEEITGRGQSIWLDGISRSLLTSGTLARHIRESGVTGLTSNPTLFAKAFASSDDYDVAAGLAAAPQQSVEEIFFKLALEDLTVAASLLRPVHLATNGEDGWVSLEVSPLLAHDSVATVREAAWLHAQAECPNLLIKIPGTAAGLLAVEQSIFAGIPVNITLLFSSRQVIAASNACLSGMERRLAAGLDPDVASVLSLFVGRWDVAVRDRLPPAWRNRLGLAVATRTFHAHRDIVAGPRWRAMAGAGARAQRLLWASTGAKDAEASPFLYVEALVAPGTINTLPEKALQALVAHPGFSDARMHGRAEAEATIEAIGRLGIDVEELAALLQTEGVAEFAASWRALMDGLTHKQQSSARGASR